MQLDGLFGERSSRSGHSENPGQPLSGRVGGMVGSGVETLYIITNCVIWIYFEEVLIT